MDGYHSNVISSRPAFTAALAAAALVVLVTIPQISASGSFQVFLSSYFNDKGIDAEGNCCSGSHRFRQCNFTCRTLFRICLSHFQSSIPSPVFAVPDQQTSTCSFGSAITPVLGENSFSVPEVLGIFINPVDIPFAFTWPGSFALTIEAWHDNDTLLMTPLADPGNRTLKLISRLSIQQSLDPLQGWQEVRHSRGTTIHFRFRVVCSNNYYGPGCSVLCRSRNDMFGHYDCSNNGTKICFDGWTGDYCNTAKCLPGCHEDHGFCEEPYQCKCRLGWEGERCDRCVVYPGCDHGTCREPWTCNCHPGWGGIFCNQDLNFCASHQPCLNSATCINTGQGSYTCLCPPGLTGTNCEVDTDDCRSEHLSCFNSGLCLMSEASSIYECHCPPEYYGRRCEASSHSSFRGDITCSDRPCQNGGKCSTPSSGAMSSQYSCSCTHGFFGINCEYAADYCHSHPCLNGGRCVHESTGFRCLCPTGYDGNRCQLDRNECTGNPCLNNGSCVDEKNEFLCVCRPEFTGRLCQNEARNCSDLPCAYGATCRDLANHFICICADGYTGKYCTTRIDRCASNPCLNGATCLDTEMAHYKCVCAAGYTGRFCDARSIDSQEVDLMRNDSKAQNGTMMQPALNFQRQLTLFLCLGICIPFLILAVSILSVVLKRRKIVKKRNLLPKLENEANDTRCLNNQCMLPVETINLKTVAEERVFLKSTDLHRNKNLLLKVDGDVNCLQKEQNFTHFTVKNF